MNAKFENLWNFNNSEGDEKSVIFPLGTQEARNFIFNWSLFCIKMIVLNISTPKRVMTHQSRPEKSKFN